MDKTTLHVASSGETPYVAAYLLPGSTMDGVTVELPSDVSVSPAILVWMGDAGEIKLRNCRLDGTQNTTVDSEGVRVIGGTAETFLIADCEFLGLKTAIRTFDSGVNVVRNFFDEIRDNAVQVEASLLRQPQTAAPLLGDADSVETTGLNRFRNVTGKALDNKTEVEVRAEINDWGAYTDDDVAERVTAGTGTARYIGKSLGLGTVVVDLTTQGGGTIPVSSNPTCSIPDLNLSGVRDSHSGLFLIEGATEGEWTIHAAATGYTPNTEVTTVFPNRINPVSISLTGEAPPPPPCGGKDARAAYACSLGILWALGKRRRSARK